MNSSLRRWVWASGAVKNMRDIGGYVCDGGSTRYGVVLRSDQLCGLTKEEMDVLIGRGLTDVIDLRSDGERNMFPNDFTSHESVELHTVKLSHDADEFQFSPHDYSCMGEMYRMMLDANAHQYTRMLGVIADAKGLSIVHCMVGKDRTGIICALLLLLLGVNEYDVVADYQVSMTYLHSHVMGTYMSDNPEMPQYLARSDPENMWMLINYLKEKYVSAENYLKIHGLHDRQFSKLRQRMVCR